MLVLTRKQGEKIAIGEGIMIHVLDVNRHTGRVRLGIQAPAEFKVLRTELMDRKHKLRKARER